MPYRETGLHVERSKDFQLEDDMVQRRHWKILSHYAVITLHLLIVKSQINCRI